MVIYTDVEARKRLFIAFQQSHKPLSNLRAERQFRQDNQYYKNLPAQNHQTGDMEGPKWTITAR
jgi:hypothetical protein